MNAGVVVNTCLFVFVSGRFLITLHQRIDNGMKLFRALRQKPGKQAGQTREHDRLPGKDIDTFTFSNMGSIIQGAGETGPEQTFKIGGP